MHVLSNSSIPESNQDKEPWHETCGSQHSSTLAETVENVHLHTKALKYRGKKKDPAEMKKQE